MEIQLDKDIMHACFSSTTLQAAIEAASVDDNFPTCQLTQISSGKW